MKDIVLTTINAKWIHPSLALRLLKANLGELEDRCEIVEFALRQPLGEKIDMLSALNPKILCFSVSIWNHIATLELLKEYLAQRRGSAEVILGGPEVSHLPDNAEIFNYADYVIKGEGEIAFKELCENILIKNNKKISAPSVSQRTLREIKTAYHLYTDEDINRKLIYVESSRGCPFNCDFCLSAVEHGVREFPLEPFLAEMDILINRGAKTLKFLDRTFNANIERAIKIIEFFLQKIERGANFTVHFEMVPTLFTTDLLETLVRFPPGSLRLEIGIQTLNPEVAARINLPGRQSPDSAANDKILETLRFLREKTNAIVHADLIAGLPGEDLESFGNGFDKLWSALYGTETNPSPQWLSPRKRSLVPSPEIQLGILKQLPGVPITRHSEEFGMRYNPQPPYEVIETSAMSTADLTRLKNFARFWEIIVNRGLLDTGSTQNEGIFNKFMALSDALFAHFGRNWGISKEDLRATALDFWQKIPYI